MLHLIERPEIALDDPSAPPLVRSDDRRLAEIAARS